MSIVQQVAPTPQCEGQVKSSNGLAVAGFVLALLGALTSFVPVVNVLGDFLALLGLIFGVAGLIKARSRGAGTGLSMAAISLAVAAFVISAVINIAAVVALNSTVKDAGAGQNMISYRSP
jgi:ABC-type transport system involved in cytochrome c biogenesis permease subunit